ncbi:hypothetical protein HHK36_012384 [Tetracentron sinense]|uniref:Uncharacterized protein n=1 Tax=Tetracentron sinense TaxID=13715 RepID=A0A834Z8L9_TETSI|nr:hypothetical protein HHK36_012384 [Tetracentron sinense]
MARSFSNAKLMISAVSFTIHNRRGYTVSSQGLVSSVVRGGTKSGGMVKQGEERTMIKERSETSSWVPDPVTGYYRPENRGDEMDVAELRETLLIHKIRQH